MKNWPKVMECYYQSWNCTNLAPELYQICMIFATTKKLSNDVESLHFPRFPQNTVNAKQVIEIVVENKEMVTGELNILSSLWEPCFNTHRVWLCLTQVLLFMRGLMSS